MKLEQLNDSQIRCTLTREDLAQRNLKLSEFAYGTDKAKKLFREVMRWASYEFGFETENMPLMIEAVPVSKDAIMLIVTKVDNPDMLDGRYAKFDDREEDDMEQPPRPKRVPTSEELVPPAPKADPKGRIIYAFSNMDDIIRTARMIPEDFKGRNRLYQDADHQLFYLLIEPDQAMDQDTYQTVCNILSEYGHRQSLPKFGDAYMQEHYEVVIVEDAFELLKQL